MQNNILNTEYQVENGNITKSFIHSITMKQKLEYIKLITVLLLSSYFHFVVSDKPWKIHPRLKGRIN